MFLRTQEKTFVGLTLTAVIFGGLLMVTSGLMQWASGKSGDWWKKVPRERNVGSAIGLLALIWAARIALPMMEGGLAKVKPFLVPAAIALGIACWFLLEYVMSRALGGILILVSATVMHMAFSEHAPARWALSLSCYLVGTAGMVMIGWPWLFRDWLEKVDGVKRWRLGSVVVVALSGAAIAGVGLMHGLG